MAKSVAPFSAGSLNRRITIQSQSTSQDKYGQPVQTWNDILSVWASIRPATGREVYASQGFVAQLSHVISLRYPDVTVLTNMRVLYDSRVFLIHGISNPDEANVQLNLLCLEST